MAERLAPRVAAVEEKVEHLDKRVGQAETDNKRQDLHLQRLDSNDQKLAANIAELSKQLGHMATKDDIADLKAEVHKGITEVLRDAINSTPLWVTVLFGLVSLAMTVGTVYVGVLRASGL